MTKIFLICMFFTIFMPKIVKQEIEMSKTLGIILPNQKRFYSSSCSLIQYSGLAIY